MTSLERWDDMTSLERWDEWFATTQDEQARKEWAAARSVHTDLAMLNLWAHIIEMNRISRHEQARQGQATPGSGQPTAAEPGADQRG